MRRWTLCVLAAGALAACGKGGGDKPPAAEAPPTPAAAPSAFAALEAQVLVPRCAAGGGCHSGAAPAGGLDLSAGNAHKNLVGVKAARRPERLRVAAGDPEGSYLVQRLSQGGDSPLMPLGGEPLPAADVERLKAWIADGAKP